MHSDSSRRRAFLTGARRCAPLVPSFIPFGLICGTAAIQVGLGEWGAAALVIPLIAMPVADAAWTSRLPHMLAAVVTGIVAFHRGGMLLPILAGFGSLYLMRLVVG